MLELARLNKQKPTAPSGVVEADETFFPVSYQGQKNGLPRAAKKRPGKTKDGDGGEKTPVVVAVQRGTQVAFDQLLPAAIAKDLTTALKRVLGADAMLSTDGHAAYWTVAKDLEVESGFFISAYHGKGGNGTWHVQSVNRYDADLKTWMARFKGVATKYLTLETSPESLQGQPDTRTVPVPCAQNLLPVMPSTTKGNRCAPRRSKRRRVVPGRRRCGRMAEVAKGPIGPEAAKAKCKHIRHAVELFAGAVAQRFPNEGSVERRRTQGGRGLTAVATSEGERGTGMSCFAS